MKKIILAATLFGSFSTSAAEMTLEQLGQTLFFDPQLSANNTQSCATCHDPGHAFTDGRKNAITNSASLGDDGHSFGNRNAPSAAYAASSPPFHFDEKLQQYVGGQFWDGRAATLADQAGGPPLNPLEMGMHDEIGVIARLQKNPAYQKAFPALFGQDIFSDPKKAYLKMTQAIQAFEESPFFSTYDSKYDRFLKGEYDLTPLEDLGRTLFFSEANVNCSTCHKLKREDALQEPFTNHQYRNIGTPSNPELIAAAKLGEDYIDHGLLNNPAVSDPKYDGKFKVPTLRNVAITAPYMHNGVFQNLRTVVEFYDKYNNSERVNNPETGQPWAAPEVPATIDLEDLKAVKMNDRKVDALVAFMKTLTDKRFEPLLKEQEEAEKKAAAQKAEHSANKNHPAPQS